jgi:hypothetical protein
MARIVKAFFPTTIAGSVAMASISPFPTDTGENELKKK